MIRLELELTIPQLAAVAAALAGTSAAVEPKTTSAKPAPKTKTEEPPAEAGKGAEVKGRDADGDDVAEVPDTAAVTAAAKTLAAKNGRDALAELLEKYGAKQLSGLAESDRAAFIEAVETATS